MSESRKNAIEAAARVAEFVRQARNLSSIDKGKLYVVWTDPRTEQAVLTMDDLESLVAAISITEVQDKAEAWEEGYCSAMCDHDCNGRGASPSNPYITELTL